jgi:hypothetical protein
LQPISEIGKINPSMDTNASTTQINLQGEIITIGPGTVPNSPGSVSQTSIKGLVESFRKISQEGGLDEVNLLDENRATANRAT